MNECEKFYIETKTEIEIILENRPYLYMQSQRWKSKDLVLSWDTDHLDQYIYSAYSPHIENLSDINHIMKRVLSLILLYNGSQYITDLNLHHKINAIGIEGKGFSENLWASEIEEYPFEYNEKFYDKSCFKYIDTPLDTVLFDLTKIDYILRTLLFLAGLISRRDSFEDKILTWSTLYKIYDTVTYGCKEAKININELAPKKKIKAFTATCNNMSVLGLNSRHGLDYGKTPKDIIHNLEEAIYIILCLSRNFATRYIKTVYGIVYKGEDCKVEDYNGRVFSYFSKEDYQKI